MQKKFIFCLMVMAAGCFANQAVTDSEVAAQEVSRAMEQEPLYCADADFDDTDFDDITRYIEIDDDPMTRMPKPTRQGQLMAKVLPYLLPVVIQMQRIWDSLVGLSVAAKIKVLQALGYNVTGDPATESKRSNLHTEESESDDITTYMTTDDMLEHDFSRDVY